MMKLWVHMLLFSESHSLWKWTCHIQEPHFHCHSETQMDGDTSILVSASASVDLSVKRTATNKCSFPIQPHPQSSLLMSEQLHSTQPLSMAVDIYSVCFMNSSHGAGNQQISVSIIQAPKDDQWFSLLACSGNWLDKVLHSQEQNEKNKQGKKISL